MDAAARAELAALRRRAYDRDADIAGDDVALERLSELEGLALAARSGAGLAPSWTSSDPEAASSTPDPFTPSGPASYAGPTADRSATGRRSPRRLLIGGLVASVTLFAAALGAIHGVQTTPDPIGAGTATAPSPIGPAATDLAANGRVTIPLLVDRVSGEFVDVSSRPAAAMFPTDGPTTWAQALGVHFGWALWAARVSSRHGPENCLLLADDAGAATEAQCIPHDAGAEQVVGVSLAFDELAEDQRPPGMTPGQRVTFGWGGGAYMTMEITDS